MNSFNLVISYTWIGIVVRKLYLFYETLVVLLYLYYSLRHNIFDG